MKLHFIPSIILVIFLSLMAILNDKYTRMLLLIPTLIFFYITLILFGIEYEKMKEEAWRRKEKKLKEKMYSVLERFQKKLKSN